MPRRCLLLALLLFPTLFLEAQSSSAKIALIHAGRLLDVRAGKYLADQERSEESLSRA